MVHPLLPAWFRIAALAYLVALSTIRVTLMRYDRTDRSITTGVVLISASMVFREPSLGERLSGMVPGGSATVYDVWHWLFLVADFWTAGWFVCESVLARTWSSGESSEGVAASARRRSWPVPRGWADDLRQRRRIWLRAMLAGAGVAGVCWPLLSAPAWHRQGATIVDVGGWRYATYYVVYGILQLSLSALVWAPTWRMRSRATNRLELTVVMVVLVIAGGGAVNTLLTSAGAIVDAYGLGDRFAGIARTTAGAEAALPFVVLGSLTLLPSSVLAVMRLCRLDHESWEVRRLRPLWSDLTRAVPAVVLRYRGRDRIGIPPRERLHRRLKEIQDAATLAGRYVRPLPESAYTLIDRTVPLGEQDVMIAVAELAAAAHRLTEARRRAAELGFDSVRPLIGDPAAIGPAQPSVLDLARMWCSAKAFAAESDPLELAPADG